MYPLRRETAANWKGDGIAQVASDYQQQGWNILKSPLVSVATLLLNLTPTESLVISGKNDYFCS